MGYVGTDLIILIKYSDERKRKKVQEILKVTEEEIGCGYTFGSSSVVKSVFIILRKGRESKIFSHLYF